MYGTLTTEEMLEALTKSESNYMAALAKTIIAGNATTSTIIGGGNFIRAVLCGDFEQAMSLADFKNKKCLESVLAHKFIEKYAE